MITPPPGEPGHGEHIDSSEPRERSPPGVSAVGPSARLGGLLAASVHVDLLARDVAALVRAEVAHDVGNILGDVPFDKFAEILGGHGEEVREPRQIRPALERAREAVRSGKPALVNIWVDRDEWAPGTRNQTMYK